MKSVFIYFCSIILFAFPAFSLSNVTPKLCINCKYFISDDTDAKFGKCSLFPKIEENKKYYLVNGIDSGAIEYHYCCVVRNDDTKCGKKGKMYKKLYLRRASP